MPLSVNSLTYLGGFRVPRLSDYSFSAGIIGVNPSTNTMFMSGKDAKAIQKVGEFSIPTFVNSANKSDWLIATSIQTPKDISAALRSQVTGGATGYLRHRGLHVHDNLLNWT